MQKRKIVIIICISACLALLVYPIIAHIEGIISQIETYQHLLKYYYEPTDEKYFAYLIFKNIFITISLFLIFALLIVGLVLFLKIDLTVYGDKYKQLRDEKKLKKAEAQGERRKAQTAKRKAKLLAELDEINRKDKV